MNSFVLFFTFLIFAVLLGKKDTRESTLWVGVLIIGIGVDRLRNHPKNVCGGGGDWFSRTEDENLRANVL